MKKSIANKLPARRADGKESLLKTLQGLGGVNRTADGLSEALDTPKPSVYTRVKKLEQARLVSSYVLRGVRVYRLTDEGKTLLKQATPAPKPVKASQPDESGLLSVIADLKSDLKHLALYVKAQDERIAKLEPNKNAPEFMPESAGVRQILAMSPSTNGGYRN